jgi:hypothetical protein
MIFTEMSSKAKVFYNKHYNKGYLYLTDGKKKKERKNPFFLEKMLLV